MASLRVVAALRCMPCCRSDHVCPMSALLICTRSVQDLCVCLVPVCLLEVPCHTKVFIAVVAQTNHAEYRPAAYIMFHVAPWCGCADGAECCQEAARRSLCYPGRFHVHLCGELHPSCATHLLLSTCFLCIACCCTLCVIAANYGSSRPAQVLSRAKVYHMQAYQNAALQSASSNAKKGCVCIHCNASDGTASLIQHNFACGTIPLPL